MNQRRPTPKKTDAERGPLGAWAYGTRTLLDVSVEDAASAAGVAAGTLRKIEGGSEPKPSRRTVWELWQYFATTGRDQGVPVEDPPEQWRTVMAPPAATPNTDAIAAAIDRQTVVLERLAKALEGLAHDQREGQGALTDEIGHVLREVTALRPRSKTAAEAPGREA